MSEGSADRSARWLLALGMAAGIALAGFGIVRSGVDHPADAEGAIAVVNGRPLSRDAFARFAAAVAAERKRVELDRETRQRLLSRMIDEELLLQRGADLELYRHEPTARRSIVSALIASVTADAEVVEPDEETLRAYFEANRDRFQRLARLDLDTALVAADGRPEARAFRRAEELATRLRAGEPFGEVREELGDAPVAKLPAGPLPFETLRQYLGPTVARTAAGLAPGEVSDPVRASEGYWVVRLRGRQPGRVPELAAIREQVRAEYLRSRGEEALREYLAELRDAAEIRVLDPELREERDE